MNSWHDDYLKWHSDLAHRLGENNPLFLDIVIAYDRIAENVAPLDLKTPVVHISKVSTSEFVLYWAGENETYYCSLSEEFHEDGTCYEVDLEEPLPQPIIDALKQFTYPKEKE